MSYNYLTIFERKILLKFQAQGLSYRAIALKLHRSPSTISREFRRLKGKYSPSRAQKNYVRKRRKCHKPRLLDQDTTLRDKIADYIQDKRWSSEQIVARFELEGLPCVSYATIYRHLYAHNLGQPLRSKNDSGLKRRLRHKNRTRHDKGKRRHKEVQTNYLSIHDRPRFINERKRLGDWEIDTVLGKTGHSVLITAVDRKSRYVLLKRVAHKDSPCINQGLIEMFSTIDSEFVCSLTPDHGTEFLDLSAPAVRLGAVVYWPDPYSPEQRGSNENMNGLLREYFPKRTNLDDFTDQEITEWQKQLNLRPKKVLNYLTATEIFFDKVLHLV